MTIARVKIIPLSAQNAEEMFDVLSPLEIYKFIPELPPDSVESLRSRYQRQEKGRSVDGGEIWLNWIIREIESNKAIGFVQATIPNGKSTAQIAYVLNPKYWNQGLAREAVVQMLSLLENEHNVRSFEAAVDWQNERSIKLLERLGFKRTEEKATTLRGGDASRDIIMAQTIASARVSSGAPWEKQVGYCRAVKRENFISVSGTAPVADDGSVFEPGNAYAQAQRCIEIIEKALLRLGSNLSEVVRTRMFVTDIRRWEDFGRAHAEAFRHYPPATSMVEVKSLIAPGTLIEIEADAVVVDPFSKKLEPATANEMVNHLSIGVGNLERSIAFYDIALARLGYSRLWKSKDAAGYGIPGQDEPFAIKQESHAVHRGSSSRSHIAFIAKSRKAVSDFYLAATENGGAELGKPGLRPQYGPNYFAAFVADPDGYKIEAVCHLQTSEDLSGIAEPVRGDHE